MKKFILALAMAFLLPTAAFAAGEKIVIGVTPFPHKDIMEVVKPILAKDGYELVIQEFSDYVQPNVALSEGQLDANFFQHQPYLDNMNKERNLKLASVAKIHIEPLGLYSQKVKGLDKIKPGDYEAKLNALKPHLKGAKISVPNDPTNEARALRLLEKHGIAKFKAGEFITAKDMIENPYKIEIVELDAAQLPRTLPDVTAAVINTNFASEAKLIPSRDAIIIEEKDSPYANVIVVRESEVNSPKIKALVKASQSPEVKAYIEKELAPKGILPSF